MHTSWPSPSTLPSTAACPCSSIPAARDFYATLLGWDCEASKVPIPGGVQYLEYGVGGTRYGGMLPMTPEWGEMPSHRSI